MSATPQAVAYYEGLAAQAKVLAQRLIDADPVASARQQQIAQQREQAARIAGLTWGDIACAIRALGMPQASEDLQALLGALSHVVVESGMDDPEGCVTHLDKASDAAEALRVMDSDEMALAHREYVREMEDDDRRAGL